MGFFRSVFFFRFRGHTQSTEHGALHGPRAAPRYKTPFHSVPFRSVSFRFVPFRSFSTTGVTRFPEKALSRSPRMALSSLHGSGSDPATAVLNETDGGVEAGLPEGTETAVLVLTSALLTAALLLSPLL